MMKLVFVLSVIGLIQSGSGQVPPTVTTLTGTCQDNQPTAMANFDISRFLKKWYVTRTLPSANHGGNCMTAEYSSGQAGVINVNNRQVNPFGTENVETATATQPNAEQPAKLVVTRTPAEGATYPPQDLWVLATNYDNHALLYSCHDLPTQQSNGPPAGTKTEGQQPPQQPQGPQRQVFVWQLVTDINNDVTNDFFQDEIKKLLPFLQISQFRVVSHTAQSCFLWNQIQKGHPVVIPGECGDGDIPRQANFDFELFQGKWNQLRRYPYNQVSNTDRCINTNFERGEGENQITILNKAINAENQEISQAGTATLNKANSQFHVTIGDQSRDLVVLATDYKNAYLYTCVGNEQTGTKQIVILYLEKQIDDQQTTPEPSSALQGAPEQGAGEEQPSPFGKVRSMPEYNADFFIEVKHEDCTPNSSSFVSSSILAIILCYVLHTLM